MKKAENRLADTEKLKNQIRSMHENPPAVLFSMFPECEKASMLYSSKHTLRVHQKKLKHYVKVEALKEQKYVPFGNKEAAPKVKTSDSKTHKKCPHCQKYYRNDVDLKTHIEDDHGDSDLLTKHGYKPTTNNEIYQEESRPSTEAHHTRLNQLELELDRILLEQGIQL